MSSKLTLVLLAATTLLTVCAAQGPVIDYLKKTPDLTTAASVLQKLYSKPIDPKAKFTLLAPTNEAIEAFRRDMRLDPAQFNDKKQLLDLVLAYHIIPGYQAKELKLKQSPTLAATGDINYLLRFWSTPKGVIVEDLQGNNVTLGTPVVLGNAAVIPINKVLMSGAYFFDGKAALKYYPQWSKAAEFAAQVGYPEGTSREQDMTLLVPDNKGMEAAAGTISKLSKEQQRDVFLYHVSQPARLAPTDFKDGSMIATNFKGHDVTVSTTVDASKTDPVTGMSNAVPTMTFTSETGNKASTKIFNVIVGKSIYQGLDAVLVPKLDGGVQTEAGAKKTPEAGTAMKTPEAGAAKNTTEAGAQKTPEAGAAAKNTTMAAAKNTTEAGAAKKTPEAGGAKKTGSRRLLFSWVDSIVTAVAHGRRLKAFGGGDYGSQQAYANTVSAQNTARAIDAAASGNIPTSYATRYGSYSAQNANNCWNCGAW